MPEAVENAKLLATRFAELRADLGGNEPDWVAVYCNGCGQIEGAHSLAALLETIAGWEIAKEFGGHDFCPRCRDKGQGWAGSFPSRR